MICAPAAWSIAQAYEDISNDKYIGYEIKAADDLYRRLPIGHDSREDVVAWMRLYALEAAQKYNPDNPTKAKFTTFLTKHLNQKSMIWFNWAWLAKSRPAGKGFVSIHQEDEEYELEEGFRISNAVTAEIQELLSHLSKGAQHFLLSMAQDEEIMAAMKTKHRRSRVCTKLQMDPLVFDSLMEELMVAAPVYVSSCE